MHSNTWLAEVGKLIGSTLWIVFVAWLVQRV